jgi:LTXXQ motif family protein
MTMSRRCSAVPAAFLLAMLLYAAPAAAQEGTRPDASAGAPKFDQQQCVRAAERFGEVLLDPIAAVPRPDGSRKELDAVFAKLKDTLRDACAAAEVLASEEGRAAADKIAAAALEATRKMGEALDEFYRSLPPEQKRKLDALGQRLALDDLLKTFSDWLARGDRSGGSDKAPRTDGSGRSLGRICIADRCFDIPGEFDFGRPNRSRDRDDFRRNWRE